jgi:hypothetical protein
MFSVDRKVFPLTGKCFPLTNFPNGKQTQESLENGFPESEFRETNMASISVYFYQFKKEGIFAQPKDQTTLFYSLFFCSQIIGRHIQCSYTPVERFFF